MRPARDQGDSKRLGAEGEALAAEFLEQLGFRVLERNYRCRLGEIDLVAKKGDRILFVEVKTRRSQEAVSALELISRAKQVHISRVAQHYMGRHRHEGQSGEFAVVIVNRACADPTDATVDPKTSYELIEDAFALSWGY